MFNVIIENGLVESINSGVAKVTIKKKNSSSAIIVKNIPSNINVGDYISLTGTYKSMCGNNGEIIVEVTPFDGSVEATGISRAAKLYAYASSLAMQEPKQSATGVIWGDAYYNAPGATQGIRYRLIFDKSIDTTALKKGLPIRVFGELDFDANQYQNKWYCNPKLFVTRMDKGAYADNNQGNTTANAAANTATPEVAPAQVAADFDDEAGGGDFSMYNSGNLF